MTLSTPGLDYRRAAILVLVLNVGISVRYIAL